MSLPTSSTLTIDVRARRLEFRIALLVLSAAGLSPWLLTAIEPFAAAAASAVCLCIVALCLFRAGWAPLACHRLTRISWQADGRWLLTDASNRTVEGLLVCSDARVAGLGVWLSWRMVGGTPQATRSLLLGPRDLPQIQLRRLIIGLRLAAARRGAPPERRAA